MIKLFSIRKKIKQTYLILAFGVLSVIKRLRSLQLCDFLVFFIFLRIKAEIYTFGMMMLEIGTFLDDLCDAYGKFQMNEDVIQNAL